MAKDESNLLLLIAGAIAVGIGVLIGFFVTGGIKIPNVSSLNGAPSGWIIDRSPDGKASAIISLPRGIIEQ